jgi:hypothetical protein
LTAPVAFALAAEDVRQAITDLLGNVAADLTSNHIDDILRRTSQEMPDRATFESNLRGLLGNAQIATSIEIRNFESSATKAAAQLDWFLEIRRDGYTSLLSTQRRRQLVRCEFAKEGKRWKFTKIDPIGFFAPPRVD